MNTTAPLAFLGAMSGGFGASQLKQGIEQAVALSDISSADGGGDIARAFARAYDEVCRPPSTPFIYTSTHPLP